MKIGHVRKESRQAKMRTLHSVKVEENMKVSELLSCFLALFSFSLQFLVAGRREDSRTARCLVWSCKVVSLVSEFSDSWSEMHRKPPSLRCSNAGTPRSVAGLG